MLTACSLDGMSVSGCPDPPLSVFTPGWARSVWERALTFPFWESPYKTSHSGLRSHAALPNPQGEAQTIGVSTVFESTSLGIRQMGWFKSKISHSTIVRKWQAPSSLYVLLPSFIKRRPYWLLTELCEVERDSVCDALVTVCDAKGMFIFSPGFLLMHWCQLVLPMPGNFSLPSPKQWVFPLTWFHSLP